MRISPSLDDLTKLIKHQLNNLFFLNESESITLDYCLPSALKLTENCFQYSKNKYYKSNGNVFFSIYHSGQYCIFLYFLARQIFIDYPEERTLADKLYYLNKTLNGLDLYYEVNMPAVFHLDHPVGSVIGRATYGDGFTFSQLCTVGNNKGVFPVIGENVLMLSGSKILGNSYIGKHTIISANTYIKDQDVPDNSIVFGSSPNLTIKKRRV
tara:strand:+ start:10832 stop:11464 length:633 start_codon:yes stop_codon:yes gene_type:complete